MRRLLACVSLVTFAISCTHNPPVADTSASREAYEKELINHTEKSNQYSGVYQTFQADVTILSTDMQTASLKQKSAYLQWNDKQYQAEREKVLQDATAYARFFMRFYTPEHDYDDLHKGKTIWKIYLDFGGQRFEGKVRKMNDKFVDLQTIYPNLDRFSTPYEVSFSVPMSRVENGPSKFTLTSSLGSAEFNFPKAK